MERTIIKRVSAIIAVSVLHIKNMSSHEAKRARYVTTYYGEIIYTKKGGKRLTSTGLRRCNANLSLYSASSSQTKQPLGVLIKYFLFVCFRYVK